MGWLKKLLRGYKGSGVLFYNINEAGNTEIILGLRRINPNRNTWSIPGGKRDVKDKSALENALREADEEGFIIPEAERKELISNPRRLIFPIMHFFEWSTFLVKLRAKPSLDLWPKKTDDFIHEFSEARWFNIHELPHNLHVGVRLVLTLKKLD